MDFIKRIDLKRNYEKYKNEYQAAFTKACELTSFSGGRVQMNLMKNLRAFVV